MRVTRILCTVVLAAGAVVGLSAPSHAASGPWMQVALGTSHTCAINTARSLYCWGNNTNGQIGNGTSGSNQLTLHRVGAAGVWARVTAGHFHTCGITTARNLYCWGYNDYGQIGNGTSGSNQLTPYRVAASGVWTDVAAGYGHTCGITTAKNLYCWGRNDAGQIGNGTSGANQLTLYRVAAAGVWAGITAGNLHTCGITTAKNLYCWGSNQNGQVGKGTSGDNQLTPYRVAASGVWANASGGESHTCGITTAKNLYCWGYNSDGQIGKGTSGGNQLTLYRVAASGVWARIAAGGFHTCGITTAKNLYCWGFNSAGQIGNGTSGSNQLTLYRVAAAGVWAGIAAGGSHTCGITTANNLYCWGFNFYGQIGTGTSGGDQLTPYRVL